MAPCSSILAWEIPWTKEPGGLQSMGSLKESDTTERLNSSMNQEKGHVLFLSLDGPWAASPHSSSPGDVLLRALAPEPRKFASWTEKKGATSWPQVQPMQGSS